MLNRKGFTLIELLIVVVIIGILAAIAIPKFANTKQKAIVASLKSDLRNLVTAEEAFFSDQNQYAGAVAAAQSTTAAAFTPSTGNVLTFTAATASGWAATITNPNLPAAASPRNCGVYVGDATPPGTPPAG
ncbi:MAG TPA: prepilin-type N-terminal cleavage/methylation domain-containing protein, partial [Gemmatimonadales bacterium]|nr:prepilin-type N-terminal cleavage/methylation domain-containing protein [Gemmatimonadales bacterium]